MCIRNGFETYTYTLFLLILSQRDTNKILKVIFY